MKRIFTFLLAVLLTAGYVSSVDPKPGDLLELEINEVKYRFPLVSGGNVHDRGIGRNFTANVQ